MKKLTILLSFLISLVSFAQHKTFNLTAFETYIEKTRKDWNIPGLSVAIVRNDSVIFSKGFGIKSIEKPDNEASNKVDGHTLFAIASLSKAFTAATLGILTDNKKIAWDDKITDRIPYFQLYDPYATREMTIRDLLSHRSGSATFGGDLLWWGTTYSRKEVIERVRYLKPAYSFRSKYGYQNIMVLTAEEIVPAVTGIQWDQFVKDSIFTPLGMKETNTSVTKLKDGMNFAIPHTTFDHKLITVPYRNVDNVGGAANLNSNVSDLSKWMRMWLRKGDKSIISDAVRHEVWTPHTPIPLSPNAIKNYPSKHFSAAGMGWFTYDYHGRKIVDHSGGMDGMISQLALIPEENTGIVILSNSISSVPNTLMYKFLDSYLAGIDRDWSAERLASSQKAEAREIENEKKAEAERNKDSKPSLEISSYTGIYKSDLYGNVEVVEKNGALYVRFIPTPSFNDAVLTHWQYDTFRIELADKNLPRGWVTFVLDKDGKAAEMKIDIPNPDFDFGELELKKVK